QLLAIPQHADAHAVARLPRAQRFSHRVDVRDLLVIESDDDVTGAETGAVRGRALAHAPDPHAAVRRRVVRDRAEVRAVAAALGGRGWRARAAPQREGRAPVRDAARGRLHDGDHALDAAHVDALPVVRRPVVVL